MKEEKQKTRKESCLLNDRLEAESIEGAQTFIKHRRSSKMELRKYWLEKIRRF